jgi:hypothetical protein
MNTHTVANLAIGDVWALRMLTIKCRGPSRSPLGRVALVEDYEFGVF